MRSCVLSSSVRSQPGRSQPGRMGGWFSRSATAAGKKVEVVNNSQLSLHLWVNGGGPVCRCPPNTSTMAALPVHLSNGPWTWTATLDLPSARSAGMQGLHVCSWNQMGPSDRKRGVHVGVGGDLRLHVDLGVHDSVDSRLSNGHGCE